MAECHICHRTLSRQADMKRHLKTHVVAGREALMHRCPEPGCKFMALQLSNLKTHHRLHTGEKNKACPTCNFKTSDPAALTRHRKKEHRYIPPLRRAQAPRTRAYTSGSSSRSISPSELSTSSVSTQSSPAESIEELPLMPRPFLTRLPTLEQGNVVSAPLPATLQNATDASYLYSLAYPSPLLPYQSPQLATGGFLKEEKYPTSLEVAHDANGQSQGALLSDHHAWFEALPHHARTDTLDSLTPFCHPQHSATVCASIGGYYQHLAIDDSWSYETMFYDPVLQYYLEFQCPNSNLGY